MWIAVVSEFQFSFGFRKKEFQTFRLQLGAGGVRNPDRSGSGSGLVAATSLDWAHEVDQDQVFHDLGQAHTPRWGSRPMGPRALQILEGFEFHRFPAANGQAVSLRRRRPTGDGGGVVRSFDFEGKDESDLVLWMARAKLASYQKAQFFREVGSQPPASEQSPASNRAPSPQHSSGKCIHAVPI